jgi:hypothetical protein
MCVDRYLRLGGSPRVDERLIDKARKCGGIPHQKSRPAKNAGRLIIALPQIAAAPASG